MYGICCIGCDSVVACSPKSQSRYRLRGSILVRALHVRTSADRLAYDKIISGVLMHLFYRVSHVRIHIWFSQFFYIRRRAHTVAAASQCRPRSCINPTSDLIVIANDWNGVGFRRLESSRRSIGRSVGRSERRGAAGTRNDHRSRRAADQIDHRQSPVTGPESRFVAYRPVYIDRVFGRTISLLRSFAHAQETFAHAIG